MLLYKKILDKMGKTVLIKILILLMLYIHPKLLKDQVQEVTKL
jgi:hypothetical protein